MTRALGRRLVPVFLLMVLALMRADRGMAELQGHSSEPSRLFHVASAPGGSWNLTLMGFNRRIPPVTSLWTEGRPLFGGGATVDLAKVLARTRTQATHYLEQIRRALP